MAPTNKVYVLTNLAGDLKGCLEKLLPAVDFIALPCSSAPLPESTVEELKNEAEIVIADPPVLSHILYSLPKCKWVQGTMAGVDALMKSKDKTKPKPAFTLTRLGGVFGIQMAEFVLGQIISRERDFIGMYERQKESKWTAHELCMYRPLSSLTITILGLGDIGCEVAKLCKTFQMRVNAVVRQQPLPTDRLPYIDEYRDAARLSEAISDCDYLCSVLPGTPQTTNLLDGDVLQACKEKQTILINVGRGNIITERTLIKALDEHWIGGAVLDVFNKEPLPPESDLWRHPSVTISPHTATQSFDWQIADVFKCNLEKFHSGLALDYVVDWEKGY